MSVQFQEKLQSVEVRGERSLLKLLRPLGRNAFNMQFELIPARRSDDLIDGLDNEIAARQMSPEELAADPDVTEINRFLDSALDDFRKDGFTYAED